MTKKLPVEGHRVKALIEMGPPDHNGSAWTGKVDNIKLQWEETVAMVELAWAAFLRCSEIINLQVCDLTWVRQRLEVCIRKAKADQLGLTAVTEIEYVEEGSEKCLLKYFEGYLKLGAGAVPPGTYCQTPQYHLVKRPRPRGLPD